MKNGFNVNDNGNQTDKQERIVISDIRLFAYGDQWGAVVELENGKEIPVWSVNGNEGVPPWMENEAQYEKWYNLALEEAHKQGYVLEGELG